MLEIRQSIISIFLAILISWALFGISNLIFLIFCILFFFIGMVVSLLHYGLNVRFKLLKEFGMLSSRFRFSRGLASILRDKDRFRNFEGYANKHAMTGHEQIDSILEQILENIMRDFVDSWYKNISPDTSFQESLKRTARRTMAAFSHCVKKVDWAPLLTRHFVDDFASHLRLYRKAKEKFQQTQRQRGLKTEDLESVFFDLELEMERSYCRDLVATSPLYESAYLHDIVDILLYLLMPSEDFRSRPLRFLIREVVVTKVIIPVLDKFSDPLYVNYLIVWLLSSLPIGTDDFVTNLETCESVQELESILEALHEEINLLRAKDNALTGDYTDSFKQQLASLEFTENLIKRRMILIANQSEVAIVKQNVTTNVAPSDNDFSSKFVHLPITVVLTHQTAVTFFAEFLIQVGGQNFIDFYLSIEGFKVSVEHQMNGLYTGETVGHEVYETVKEAALFMYRQYLSHEAITRVPLDDSMINKFLARVRNDEPFDNWFEQIQEKLVDILTKDDRFYPAFKRHSLYLQMLENLGVIEDEEESQDEKIEILNEEDDNLNMENYVKSCDFKNKNFLFNEKSQPQENFNELQSGSALCNHNHREDFDLHLNTASETERRATTSINEPMTNFLKETIATSFRPLIQVCVETLGLGNASSSVSSRRVLGAGSVGTGATSEKLFALYNVRVTRTEADGRSAASWNVIRRYSDFHTLNATITSRCILQPTLLDANVGLEAEIFHFLSQHTGLYRPINGKKNTTRDGQGPRLSQKVVSAMFDPILSGVKAFGTAVTSMPDQVFDGIGKVSSELNKAATHVLKSNNNVTSLSGSDTLVSNPVAAGSVWRNGFNYSLDSNRVAAHIDDAANIESIPLRVLLLFLDEVFGLRGRNQWFRRRLVALLRHFVNTALGTSINRRILDAVQWLTGADLVVQYLVAFRDSLWGDTTISELTPSSEALRTRFLARCLMLSALPDELRLFIGASTTIQGINNISEALQNRHLNRRFWYVIFERLLTNIFPNNRFDRILPILHAKSPRAQFN